MHGCCTCRPHYHRESWLEPRCPWTCYFRLCATSDGKSRLDSRMTLRYMQRVRLIFGMASLRLLNTIEQQINFNYQGTYARQTSCDLQNHTHRLLIPRVRGCLRSRSRQARCERASTTDMYSAFTYEASSTPATQHGRAASCSGSIRHNV